MLLIPTGLEGRPVLRTPWVTLALIAANVAIAIVSTTVDSARQSDAAVLFDLVEKSLRERPYLAMPERLTVLVDQETLARVERERALERIGAASPSAEQRQAQQRALESLVDELHAALERLPTHRFGFVPARPTLASMFSSMFMHAGWLHLLGNMLFLYAGGPYIEDVYGRPLFLLSYLASGLAAVGGQYFSSPHGQIPLVGASGAIAGVMGMLLVRLWHSRIRFLCLPFVIPIVRFRLSLPALVVLPLWFLEQLWYGQRAMQGGGVAWWAHVAGFVFGCALAGSVKLLRVEERWLGTAFVSEQSRALDGVSAARESGDYAAARAELRGVLASEPDSVDAWRESYELALAEGDAAEATRALMRLLELLPRRGAAWSAIAIELIDDMRWTQLAEPPARLYLAIAGVLDRKGDVVRAVEYYDAVVREAPRDALALRALVRKGELLIRTGDAAGARRTLEQSRTHPAFNETWRATVDGALTKLAAGAPPRSGR
jgi:membrane associated rhomboid family serine protease